MIIEGIHISEGIKNCGSRELFLSSLRDFYKLIDTKSAKIEDCLAKGLIRDYTIEVHGLKNTARMIGALELSDFFYQMEKLGNAGDVATIKEQTPELLRQFRSYKQILEPYGKSAEERKQVTLSQIKETVQKLHDAVDGFDLDTADEAMKELESYILPEEMGQMAEQISVALADVAMEDVLAMTETMLEQLSAERSRIMIVDDDEVSCKIVTAMLQSAYDVCVANSSQEAFAHMEEHVPDLILLDVHMPEMNGHEMIRVLKEDSRYADVPVVFLTSDEDENTEIQGFSEGAIDFIRKPFRKNVATQRIRRILELSYLQKNLKQEVEKQTAVAEERRKRVERMSLQMVQTLANTIDAKDAYTNGHSTRVAKYSVMIAEKMGYDGERLEQLQYAALLHDIGKIGIPREIINKPSRLSDEEYELIKSHPEIGANILKEITEIPDIAIGARWHHERYDGKGYPDCLSGEEIPELARIIGVADAYDAMTSKRSYRDVLPQEVVLAEIEKGKGSQFDPDIAEIMVQLMKADVDYRMHE